MAQQGLLYFPMKKIASSEEMSAISPNNPHESSSYSSSSDDEEEDQEYGDFHNVWREIRDEKKNKKDTEKTGEVNIWSSIQCKNKNDTNSLLPLPPPYIHSLVKTSSSTLCKESLEICTESVGSETGSDEVSPPEELKKNKEEEKKERKSNEQAILERAPRLGKCEKKLSFRRSYPPPLSSLSDYEDGSILRMQSRRDDGRLFLDAVSMFSSKTNFQTQRGDGRLVLSLSSLDKPERKNEKVVEEDQSEANFLISVEGNEGGEEVDFEEVEEEEHDPKEAAPLAQSLPMCQVVSWIKPPGPTATPATSASLDMSDYHWRPKPKPVTIWDKEAMEEPTSWDIHPGQEISDGSRGGCKVPKLRRYLLLWEPYCIASS